MKNRKETESFRNGHADGLLGKDSVNIAGIDTTEWHDYNSGFLKGTLQRRELKLDKPTPRKRYVR